MVSNRRVVTWAVDGKSVIVSDGPAPNSHSYRGLPGFRSSIIWGTPSPPSIRLPADEPAPPRVQVVPAAGETRLMIFTFPPVSVFSSPDFDPALTHREQAEHIPGLADTFESEDPAMHATKSIDYAVVLEGEVWLELDDGVTTHLRTGDIVIQGAARHAWRNKGTEPVKLLFVLIGATD
jgi:mannose-6-phosphate isomerase-like protein (cupin superfamily)